MANKQSGLVLPVHFGGELSCVYSAFAGWSCLRKTQHANKEKKKDKDEFLLVSLEARQKHLDTTNITL